PLGGRVKAAAWDERPESAEFQCPPVCSVVFFFSSRRRHTRSVLAFLLNRSSDLILKSGVNHTSRGSISTSTLPSIKLRKCSSKIITSILSFISGRLATKSNQIKQLIRNGRS